MKRGHGSRCAGLCPPRPQTLPLVAPRLGWHTPPWRACRGVGVRVAAAAEAWGGGVSRLPWHAASRRRGRALAFPSSPPSLRVFARGVAVVAFSRSPPPFRLSPTPPPPSSADRAARTALRAAPPPALALPPDGSTALTAHPPTPSPHAPRQGCCGLSFISLFFFLCYFFVLPAGTTIITTTIATAASTTSHGQPCRVGRLGGGHMDARRGPAGRHLPHRSVGGGRVGRDGVVGAAVVWAG